MAAQAETVKIGAILAVVLILGVAFVIVAASRLQISGIADVDTIGYDGCELRLEGNTGVRGFGRFPDLAGDARARGEIWSSTRLWYAWFSDGESRPAVVEGVMKDCGPLGSPLFWPDHAVYAFDYSEDGSSWTPFYQDRIPTGSLVSSFSVPFGASELPLGAFEIILDGFERCRVETTRGCPLGESVPIKDGSALRVSVSVRRDGWPSYGPQLIAQDEIELRSAIPDLRFSKAGYLVGETAIISWRIPTTTYQACDASGSCTTQPAYFLEVLDMNTNGAIPGFNRIPLTTTSGSLQIPITGSLISNDLASCANRLRAIMYTPIIVADLDETSLRWPEASITGGDAPTITSIVFDKPEYREGDLVKVSWTVDGTADRFHVTAHIGGMVVFDQDVDGTAVSFTAPRTGTLEVSVTGYNRCTPSDVVKGLRTIGNQYPGLCELFSEIPQCAGTNLLKLIAAVLAVIGIFASFLLVFFLAVRIAPKQISGFAALLIALIASGILALAFVGLGVLDPLIGAQLLQGVNG